MTDELKPCPFCGGKARGFDSIQAFTIDCQTCDMEIYRLADRYRNNSEAAKAACITAWNTRADTPDPANEEARHGNREALEAMTKRAEEAEGRLAKVVEKFAALESAASYVSRKGAETGPQWTKLTIALLTARVTLAKLKGQPQ